MGSDSFSQIGTWHRWQELVELAHLVVLHRDTVWGKALEARVPEVLLGRMRTIEPFRKVPDPEPGSRWIYLLEHEPFPISATDLRERLRAGLDHSRAGAARGSSLHRQAPALPPGG